MGDARHIHIVDKAGPRQLDREDRLNTAGPGGQQHDAVRQTDRLTDIVRDKDDRFACSRPDLLEHLVEVFSGLGIQRRERLVHEKHLGLDREGARNGDALAHPTRQLMNVAAGEPTEMDQMQVVFRALNALSGGYAHLLQAEFDVLLNG